MRRIKNISQRAAMAILAASILISSASAVGVIRPSVAYAGDTNNNSIENNPVSGDIEYNNGTVENNYGQIDHNEEPGTVVNNCSGGTVNENNSGLEEGTDNGHGVRYNSGTVNTNNGLVGENMAAETEDGIGGKVEVNNGTITTNNSGLGDNGNNDGVRKNYGTITENNGYVYQNSDKNNPDKGKIIYNDGNGQAVVNLNYGEIRDNSGKVNTNYGIVGDNTGLVDSNKNNGVVTDNKAGGTINGNYADVIGNHGTIDNNYKNVENNYGKITNNKNIKVQINANGDINHLLGKVTNNYGEITTNDGEVNDNKRDDTLGTGSIGTNNGVVTSNHGIIGENNIIYDDNGQVDFSVKTNESDGVIKLNNGAVEYSYGTIEINKNAGLDWVNNFGTITDNYGDVHNVGNPGNRIYGRIVNQYAGEVVGEHQKTVIENMYGGELHGEGIIVNYFNGDLYDNQEIPGNFNGKIENNFTDVGTGTPDKIKNAANQFRSVSFTAAENSSRTYGEDFTEKTVMNTDGTKGDTKYYINVTGGNGAGTITIVASKGYELKNTGADSGSIVGESDMYSFSYTLVKQENGSYLLSITEYNGNSCELSAGMFNLVVQAIENVNPDKPVDPVNPVKPDEPVNPVNPDEPVNPVNPVDPVEPVNPVDPVDPIVPDENGGSSDGNDSDSGSDDPAGFTVDNSLGVIVENTVNDRDAGVISASDAAVIAMISEVPAGGTVSIPDLAETGLSASVVQAIMARNGEPINFTYVIGGVTYLIEIPAGFDLLALLNTCGGLKIDLATLINVLGANVIG